MLPPDASADGHRIDALLHLSASLVAGCFVFVVLALVVLLWRYRARPGLRGTYSHGTDLPHLVLTLGLAVGVLVGVDINLVARAHTDLVTRLWALPHGPDVVRVEVLARRWSWQVRYAGPDGLFGTPDDVVTLDDLRVPLGRPVSVQLRALDVVHSFFLPQFRVKQDAIPGRVTRAWFRPLVPGTYEIACAQLCGWAHYRMRGVLRVVPPADWDRWLRDASADALRGSPPGSSTVPVPTASTDRPVWPWED